MITLCKIIKAEFSDDLKVRAKVSDAIARFLSSCADEKGDDLKYHAECTFVFQTRPDGMLAVIGQLDREATPFYRSEIIEKEFEFIPNYSDFVPPGIDTVDPIFVTR